MPRNTESLIDELVASAPARQRRRLSAAVVSIGFFFLFTVAVTSVMYVVSPFRSSLGHELLGLPRFAIEMIAGLAFVAYAVYLSIQLSIPGLSAIQRRRYAYLLFALLLSWLLLMASVYVVELMPVTMSGKRHLCFVETVIYAWPGSLILLVLVLLLELLNKAPRRPEDVMNKLEVWPIAKLALPALVIVGRPAITVRIAIDWRSFSATPEPVRSPVPLPAAPGVASAVPLPPGRLVAVPSAVLVTGSSKPIELSTSAV